MRKQFAIENAVDPEVHVYVPRVQDEQLLAELETSFLCFVQGSRMSGKSSLLLRTVDRLAEQDALALYVDLVSFAAPHPDTLHAVVRRLVSALAELAGAGRPACLQDAPPVAADFLIAGLREIAGSAPGGASVGRRIVVLLDELDTIAGAPWAAELFATLREVARRRRTDPILDGLRIVLAGVRPFRYVVSDPAGAGVGAPDSHIWLDDFANDAATAAVLAQGFEPELRDKASPLTWKALEFSGGYPQACTWLCRAMVHEHMTDDLAELELRLVRLAEHERRSPQPPRFFKHSEDYLRSYARSTPTIADPDPHATALEAMWVYLEVLRRSDVPFDGGHPAHDLLRWAGLARCDQTGVLRCRSPLLERFYTASWARELRRSIEVVRVRPASGPVRRTVLPRVCVLTTGGTIGMVQDASGKIRAPSSHDELDEAYAAVGRIADVQYVQALENLRDSANVVPEHWSMVAERVAEWVSADDVAGVVVTHGTDTLAYTASAVAYALGEHLTKPVVFTGSQATVNVPHGDAIANLLRACKVAAEAGPRLPEVVVCFGDKVLRSCRAQKKDDRRFDAFESPLWPPLAVITEEIEYSDGAIRRSRASRPPLDLRARFDSRILTLAQVPGLHPRLLEPVLDTERAEDGVRAVLIQSLGAGNLPTERGYSLVSFIEKAVARDIPVILASPYPVLTSNPEKYAPAEAAIQAGALPVFNITLPALVTKLAWVLGGMPPELDHADPRSRRRAAWVHERMRTNYVGETDDHDETYLEFARRMGDRIRRP